MEWSGTTTQEPWNTVTELTTKIGCSKPDRSRWMQQPVPYQPDFGPPKHLQGPPNGNLQKKFFDVKLYLETEWSSKENILIADTILAEPGL